MTNIYRLTPIGPRSDKRQSVSVFEEVFKSKYGHQLEAGQQRSWRGKAKSKEMAFINFIKVNKSLLLEMSRHDTKLTIMTNPSQLITTIVVFNLFY